MSKYPKAQTWIGEIGTGNEIEWLGPSLGRCTVMEKVEKPVKIQPTMEGNGMRKTGCTKWFNETKGFGYLIADSGEEYFVHHSAIMSKGFRTLYEDTNVTFDAVESPKGLRADNVLVID